MQLSLRSFMKKSPHWVVAIIAILMVSFYWFVWAQDRYVSRATVVLESPQVATPEFSLSSLMGGGGGSTQDLLLLREHLLSLDMLRRLDEELNIREPVSITLSTVIFLPSSVTVMPLLKICINIICGE